MIQVNLAPVIASGAASMAVGFAWYSKALFGNQWMKLTGLSSDKIASSEMGKTFGLVFVATLVMGYILSMFIHYAGAYSLVNGAKTGLWAWIGFVFPATLANHLFSKEKHELYALVAGHHLVAMLVMGAILGSWY